jgi:hypothetical protein
MDEAPDKAREASKALRAAVEALVAKAFSESSSLLVANLMDSLSAAKSKLVLCESIPLMDSTQFETCVAKHVASWSRNAEEVLPIVFRFPCIDRKSLRRWFLVRPL